MIEMYIHYDIVYKSIKATLIIPISVYYYYY